MAVFAVLSGLFFWMALAGADGRPDSAETIAFQWTMPGLDEELFYRGTLLLALIEAFWPKSRLLGAPIGHGGLLTTILFGLTHALSYKAGVVDFDLMTFAMTGVRHSCCSGCASAQAASCCPFSDTTSPMAPRRCFSGQPPR